MTYVCPTCKATGFGKSVIKDRCHFCDGTESGDGPIVTPVGWALRRPGSTTILFVTLTEPTDDTIYENFDVERLYTITEPM